MKTSELTDRALDWVVTMIEKPEACEYGVEDWVNQRKYTVKNGEYVYRWHQSWMQSGPIIEREMLKLHCGEGGVWWAATYTEPHRPLSGSTPLIAAMRCYVASVLGEEVDVPEELQ